MDDRMRVVAEMSVLHAPVRSCRLGGRRRLLFGLLVCVLALGIVFVAGRVLWDASLATDFAAKNLSPCLDHPFGTDQMGRDVLARTVSGLSTSLLIGALVSMCTGVIALALALFAVCGGRVADTFVIWLCDLMTGVPHIVLLILVSYALGRGFWGVTAALALTHWPSLTRVLRVELMQLVSSPHMKTSMALGAGGFRGVLPHAVPAIIPQLVMGMVLAFPHAILHESSLTFLGFGLPLDEPAVGSILAEAMGYLTAGMWWQAILPGLSLVACVLLIDCVGRALRGVLSARTVQR